MPESVTVCALCDCRSYRMAHRESRSLALPEPFQVVQCCDCGFRWLTPRPTEHEYQEFYRTAYFEDGRCESDSARNLIDEFPVPAENYSEEVARRVPWYHHRLSRIRRLLPAGKSVIDIGAGSGEFLNAAREQGWEAFGIEPSEWGREKAAEQFKIKLERGDVWDNCYEGLTFDVVHLSHVFEHIARPRECLTRLAELMNADSLLVLEVPNQFESLVRELDQLVYRRERRKSFYSIHHPYFYTHRHLCQLVRRSGLSVCESRTHFPERWRRRFRTRVTWGLVDWVGDKLFRGGNDIEVIARKHSERAG